MRMLEWPRVVSGIALPPQNIALTTHGLAALTKVVLAHGNKWEMRLPAFEDVVKLQNQVEHLPNRFTKAPTGTMSPEEFFFQLANQQFPFQIKAERRALARALVLYEQVPDLLRKEGYPIPFELNEEFTKLYGLSMRHFIWAGLWGFGCAIEGKTFRLGQIDDEVKKLREQWAGPADDIPSGDDVRQFLHGLSLGVGEFAALIGDLRKQDQSLAHISHMAKKSQSNS